MLVASVAARGEPLPEPPRYATPPDAGSPAGGAASAPETVAAPAPAAENVVEVRIVGNETTSTTQIASHLTTRAGRPFDVAVVQRDVRKLASLGWFVDVKSLYETTPQGRIVVFQVVERPTIRYVSYLGNTKVRDKTLAKQTLLKAGGAVDPYSVEEGRRKIQDYYTGRGYNNVQVTILEGNRATDQGVVYLIHEGPPQKVWDVNFVGNEFVSGSVLKTKVKSKPPTLMLFKGYVNRDAIDADRNTLTAYYRSYGYFQAKISPHFDFNDEGNWLTINWIIHEGPRYEVRDVRFIGVSKFAPDAMTQQLKLTGGHPFEQGKMQDDTQWVQDLYGSNGYVFADVKPETVFLEEPGKVDLMYHIDEGQRWRVGRIFVHIGGDNPHTRIQTALNRVTIYPGQIMDIRELKASERRLAASSVFNVDPASGQRPKITFRIPEDADLEFAERASPSIRGQSPDSPGPAVIAPPSALGQTPFTQPVAVPPPVDDGTDVHVYCDDYAHYLRWVEAESAANAMPYVQSPALGEPGSEAPQAPPTSPTVDPSAGPSDPPATPGLVIRGQSPAAAVHWQLAPRLERHPPNCFPNSTARPARPARGGASGRAAALHRLRSNPRPKPRRPRLALRRRRNRATRGRRAAGLRHGPRRLRRSSGLRRTDRPGDRPRKRPGRRLGRRARPVFTQPAAARQLGLPDAAQSLRAAPGLLGRSHQPHVRGSPRLGSGVSRRHGGHRHHRRRNPNRPPDGRRGRQLRRRRRRQHRHRRAQLRLDAPPHELGRRCATAPPSAAPASASASTPRPAPK